MNEREAYIALNMMERIGPVTVRSLVEVVGSACNIFLADKADLLKARGVGQETADAITRQASETDWQGEIEKAESEGISIVTQVDREYPGQLLDIHDPPLALYVKGNLESRDKHSIAVVGTRRPSNYGRRMAEEFAMGLANAGYVVISGLALGIDTEAHKSALKAKGRTLAVMGSSMDNMYPESNRGLSELISRNGAVMSELPFGRQADKTTFPMRNRIVSGLSAGVLVIEAGSKSGALITANQACEQGRDVFAVPGRIDVAVSQGCHRLIQNGAKLVTCLDDVLAEYEFLISKTRKTGAPASSGPELSPDEARIMDLLRDGPQNVDELIRLSGLQTAMVNALLIRLEMKRKVRMLPGRIVESAGFQEQEREQG